MMRLRYLKLGRRNQVPRPDIEVGLEVSMRLGNARAPYPNDGRRMKLGEGP